MNRWFIVKVRYTKQNENGTFKRVTEPYLLSAHTFTDAEARIYEELGEVIRGEFDVVSITRAEFHDIFQFDDSMVWWKCKVTYTSIHADDKEKQTTQTFLTTAETAKEAFDRVGESLKNLQIDFEIVATTKTPIIDVFPAKEEVEESEDESEDERE